MKLGIACIAIASAHRDMALDAARRFPGGPTYRQLIRRSVRYNRAVIALIGAAS